MTYKVWNDTAKPLGQDEAAMGRMVSTLIRCLHAWWAARSNGYHAKVAIVLVVFPVFVEVILIFFWAPLVLLRAVLPASAAWLETLSRAVERLGTVIALVGAFLVCKLIWPKKPAGASGQVSSR